MRLAPLPDDEWDGRARAALAVLLPENRLNVRGAGNALATLVRHPDLTAALMTFNKHLMLHSSLPARLRELAILRVARRRSCAYEWSHHVRMAMKLGLSEAEIEAAGNGRATGELETAVLTAVDELDHDSRLSDPTWAALDEHLDERQRMDLVFTIGAYCMLAMAFNTFGVEPEPAKKSDPER
jgi:4-carboxymuconolactone decarboxylase